MKVQLEHTVYVAVEANDASEARQKVEAMESEFLQPNYTGDDGIVVQAIENDSCEIEFYDD
jgi:hypothetical protein